MPENLKIKQRFKKATSLGDALKGLFENLGSSDKIYEFELARDWEKVVGKGIAQNSEPLQIKKGILFLKVKNSVWRNQLSFLSAEIIERVNLAAKKELVKKIMFH